MADNIQKLYEIAGVYSCNMPDIDCSKECNKCADYNPFTAEKQLQLIKILGNNEFFNCFIVLARCSVDYGKWSVGIGSYDVIHEQFEQALAGLVLEMWDELPSKQKQEIKGILE